MKRLQRLGCSNSFYWFVKASRTREACSYVLFKLASDVSGVELLRWLNLVYTQNFFNFCTHMYIYTGGGMVTCPAPLGFWCLLHPLLHSEA